MARHAWRACAALAVARAELSAGCGVASTDWLEYVGMESLPLSLNGHNHILTLPRNYDASTPVPLVLYLHGWGGDASERNQRGSTVNRGEAPVSVMAQRPAR